MVGVDVQQSQHRSETGSDIAPHAPHVGRGRQGAVHAPLAAGPGGVGVIPVDRVHHRNAGLAQRVAHRVERSQVLRLILLVVPAPVAAEQP